MSVLKRLIQQNKNNKKDPQIRKYLKGIVGYTPKNFHLFKLATVHSSAAKTNNKGQKESNERLEYLGDAILGAVIAEYLFKKFPFKDEGFLTDIRSRIVSRESLNNLGRKLGLENVIELDKKITVPHKSVYGDTLEALVGAVYLDRGFRYCRKFILAKLIEPHFNIKEIVESNPNFKSQIIEWSQKIDVSVIFETIEVKDIRNHKEFTVRVMLNGDVVSTGQGTTKKKAEQDAAEKAWSKLNLGDES